MFENVGRKIKKMAIVCAIIGAALGAYVSCDYLFKCGDDGIWTGLIMFLASVVGSLILGWLLYGYGVLIENSENMNKTLEFIQKSIIAEQGEKSDDDSDV